MKTKAIQIRLSEQLWKQLTEAREERGRSLNSEIATRLELSFQFGRIVDIQQKMLQAYYEQPKHTKDLMAECLEEFYERRKNAAIDREVDRKLKELLLTAAGRIPPIPSP